MEGIVDDLYFEVSDLANSIAKKTAIHFSKKIEEIKCHDIEQYMIEVEHVEFVDYNFKNNLNKKLLGSINKVQGEFIITTNTNLLFECKNFTKMHEIMHYYRDFSYDSKSHAFSDLILQKDYLPEDFDKEIAADIGAGILMANDQALKHALEKLKTFDQIANYFCIHKPALKIRIMHYLEFTERYTYNIAYKLFKEYYYKNNEIPL